MKFSAMYHDGYANLAAAILKQAERENDKAFLDSDWAGNLKYMCTLDDRMYGDRTIRMTCGVVETISNG